MDFLIANSRPRINGGFKSFLLAINLFRNAGLMFLSQDRCFGVI